MKRAPKFQAVGSKKLKSLLCTLSLIGAGCALDVGGHVSDAPYDDEELELAGSTQAVVGTLVATVTDKTEVGPQISYDGTFAYLTSKAPGATCGLVEKINLSTGAKTTLIAGSSSSCNRKGESTPLGGYLYYEDHTREDWRRVTTSSPFTDSKLADISGSEASLGLSTWEAYNRVAIADGTRIFGFNPESNQTYAILEGSGLSLSADYGLEVYFQQYTGQLYKLSLMFEALLGTSAFSFRTVAVNATHVFYTQNTGAGMSHSVSMVKKDGTGGQGLRSGLVLLPRNSVVADNASVYVAEWTDGFSRASQIMRISNYASANRTVTQVFTGRDQRDLLLTSTKLYWLETANLGLGNYEHRIMRGNR